MTTVKARKTYPFIKAYCKLMGSFPYYLHDELEAAGRTGAPADAYASKDGPSRAKGPEDWLLARDKDDAGRKRLEHHAGISVVGELSKWDEYEGVRE